MDKEEILGSWALHGEEDFECSIEMEKDSILRAMSEYANQEAVSFAEWISMEGYVPFSQPPQPHLWTKGFDNKRLTTEQLYTLYKQSKQLIP